MPGEQETPATEGAPATEANAEETPKAEGKAEEDKVNEGEKKAEEVKTMRCVVLTGFGGTRMMKEQRKLQPSPAQGQLLIRVSACGMSFQDLMLRQGIVEPTPRTPLIMGSECAGVVEALGPDTQGFTVGDRVAALTNFSAWAELVVVPVTQVYKLPDSVDFQDGVSLLMHYITAYILLFDLANLHQGQSLLVHSAAGGVGQAILQLSATVDDVTVFGTASSHKHKSLEGKVTHLFAHNVDYAQQIRKESPQGLDIVLDCLCGEDTNRGIGLLKPLGTYILYGSSNIVTGETKSFFSFAKSWWQLDKINPLKLYEENHVIGGFQLKHLLFRQGCHTYIRSIVDKVLELYVQGKIKPVIDSVWAFEDVGEGMQRLQDRKNIGKVLLDPGKEPVPKRKDSKAAVVEAADVLDKNEEGKDDQKTEKSEEGTDGQNAEKSEEGTDSQNAEKSEEGTDSQNAEKSEEGNQKAETTETPAADAQ